MKYFKARQKVKFKSFFYCTVHKVIVIAINKIPLVHIANGFKNLFAEEHKTRRRIVKMPGLVVALAIVIVNAEAMRNTLIIYKFPPRYLYLPGTVKHHFRKYYFFFFLNGAVHQVFQQERLRKFNITI